MAILILYASAGNGHRRAAQAVYEAFISAGREDVTMIDILDFTPMWFKWIYSQGYMKMINRARWLWRYLFNLTNRPYRSFVIDFWHNLLNRMATRSLGRYLRQVDIDIVVTTHFMANDVVAHYRDKYSFGCKLVCVVTDYVVHRFWFSSKVDKYFVGCSGAKRQLMEMGVPEDRVTVSGIPVPASFLKTLPRELLLRELGLEDKFTILMLANAVRDDLIVDAVKVLMMDMQIIVGCGKNWRLQRKLEELAPLSSGLKVYGKIDHMDYAMSVADLIVTKPGGLVVSEAIVKRLPMVLIDPIPGQEEGNRDFVVESGMGLFAKGTVDLIRHILFLKHNPDKLSKMVERLDSMPSGDVAGRIVWEVLNEV